MVFARSAAALLLVLTLGGCWEGWAIAGGINAGSLMLTGGTVPDVVVSLVTGKTCSVVRLEQGRTYCREDEPNPKPNVYCYATLATPDCYSEPLPVEARRQELGPENY